MKRLLNEPVAVGAVVRLGILAAMAFGLKWTPEQLAAVMAFVEAVLLLVTRTVVTPNHIAEARVAAGGSPTKPLSEANGVSERTRSTLPIVLLAVALSVSACASSRHRVTVTVVSAHAVLSAVQDTEMLLVCERPTAPSPPACVPEPVHRDISLKLAKAFDTEIKVAKLARATPAALSSDVPELLGQIGALVDAIVALIPESAQRRALVANIGGAK
jgi:hypothetical protein